MRSRARSSALLLAGTLALLLAGAALAAPPVTWRELLPVSDDGQGQRLSESEAVERALANSRQLESLDTDVAIAEGRRESAGALKNPSLRVQDISSEYFRDRFDKLSLGLRWSPPRLGELAAKEQEAELGVTRARVDAERARLEARARVRHAYAELVLLEQLVRVRAERLDLETRRLDLVERLKDMGERSIVYVTKARMRQGESRSELSRLEQSRNETRRDLARRIGLPLDATLMVSAEPLPEQLLSFEQLQAVGARQRPEEELIRQRRNLATAQFDLERSRRLPWPSFVELGYHVDQTGKARDWVELSFGLQLPIFDWNSGAIRAAGLDVARKETLSAALAERLENELRDRYAAWRDALLDWQLSTADAEALVANANVIIAEAKLHATVPPDEVFELQIAVQDAREIVCRKRFALAEALNDLMLTVGVAEPGAIVAGSPSP